MRGGLSHNRIQLLTGAAFCCAALVLLQLLASLGLFTAPPAATATPTPAPETEQPVVAFLGSAQDYLCAPLYGALEELCGQKGWRLISYDCKGYAVNQTGQAEDFLRTETADVAVIWPVLEQEELDRQVKALAACCPVVTVGRQPGGAAARQTAAHVGLEEKERLHTLAQYLKGELKKGQGALLLTERPVGNTEARYKTAFAADQIEILGNNYTWDNAFYARRYLITALDDIEEVGAVVCTSRHGTVGTWNTLQEKDLRDNVRIVSLFYEPAMADDLALGELDAAVAVDPKEMGDALAELLPEVLQGKRPGTKPLTPILLTPENLEETGF